jgi:hypothetical protein
LLFKDSSPKNNNITNFLNRPYIGSFMSMQGTI